MNGNGESQEQIDASDAEALSSPLDNDGGINTEAVQTPDPIEVLRKENEELKDRVLRLIAETENMRRRSRREIADARQFSIANFARDMLAVGDNLRRAIESITPEMRENTGESWTALIGGVEMTEREMLNKMQGHGVKLLDPQGTQFDPHFHQAMFEIPDPSVPAGTVLQVVQSGYVIGERVLRPAMVGIAKDGPKLAGEMKADQQRGDDAEPASPSDRQPEGKSSDSKPSDSEPYDRKPTNDASADHESVNLYEQTTQKSGEESSVDRKV